MPKEHAPAANSTAAQSVPADQPAQATAAKAPPRQQLGIYSLLANTMDYATDSEKEFLYEFLEECAAGTYSVQKVALWKSAGHYGIGISPDTIDRWTKNDRENIDSVLQILGVGDLPIEWWLTKIISGIAYQYRHVGQKFQVDDLYWIIEQEITQINCNVVSTKQILRFQPGLVADEIQKAAQALQEANRG